MALALVVKANHQYINQAMQDLLEELKNSKPYYTHGCVDYALGEIVKAQPNLANQLTQPLLGELENGDDWARTNAADALGKIVDANHDLADQVSVPLLRALGKDTSEEDAGWARRSAASALGKVATARHDLAEQFVQPLRERLADSSFLVRYTAAEALGEIARIYPGYRAEVFALSISDVKDTREGVSEPLAKLLATLAAPDGDGYGSNAIQFLFDHLEGKQSLLPVNVKNQCGEDANTCAAYRQIVVNAMAYWLVSKKQSPAVQFALKQRLETMRDSRDTPLHLRIAAWDALVLTADFRNKQAAGDFDGFDE